MDEHRRLLDKAGCRTPWGGGPCFFFFLRGVSKGVCKVFLVFTRLFRVSTMFLCVFVRSSKAF